MKFRIMQNEYGTYIQVKRFGFWVNCLLHANYYSIFLDKTYYENSVEEIEKTIKKTYKLKTEILPKLIKEIEVSDV